MFETIVLLTLSAWSIAPCLIGLYFLSDGLKKLFEYDEEYDDIKKNRNAILDIILGITILIIYNIFFWFVLWPFFIFTSGLKLPVPPYHLL